MKMEQERLEDKIETDKRQEEKRKMDKLEETKETDERPVEKMGLVNRS